MQIDEPGEYQISENNYHADPCPIPSLSASIGKILLERSPRHAWTRHARLGKGEGKWTKAMNVGSAVHDILFRGDNNSVVWFDYRDWRTKAAREDRDSSIDNGLIPLLEKNETQVYGIVEAVRREWGDAQHYNFERVFVWKEGDSWCRTMQDMTEPDGKIIVDLKCTDLAATPEGWVRTQMPDYLMQVGMYRRAMDAIYGNDNALFFFLVVEMQPPYGIDMPEPDAAGYALADKIASRAIEQWQFSSAKGWGADAWRCYQTAVYRPPTPTWLLRKWGIDEC